MPERATVKIKIAMASDKQEGDEEEIRRNVILRNELDEANKKLKVGLLALHVKGLAAERNSSSAYTDHAALVSCERLMLQKLEDSVFLLEASLAMFSSANSASSSESNLV